MNHQDIVERIKSELQAKGVDLSGACGAFQITKRVAWALRNEGFGLLSKPAGNNCEGYATDIVVDVAGNYYDILGDGGGANNPQWPDEPEAGDRSRFRAAIDPGDTPSKPDEPPVPPVEPEPDVIALVLAKLDAIEQKIDALQAPTVVFPSYEATNKYIGHILFTPKS